MNKLLSGRSSTASAIAGSEKLGHPVPESNLASESNNLLPQPAHEPGTLAVGATVLAAQAGVSSCQEISVLLAVGSCLTSSATAGTMSPGRGRAGW